MEKYVKVNSEEEYRILSDWAESKGYTWTSGSKYSSLNLYKMGSYFNFVEGFVISEAERFPINIDSFKDYCEYYKIEYLTLE